MHFNIISILPELFDGFFSHGVIGRAFNQGLLSEQRINPRDTVQDSWKRVDDRPYGGGPGMVMMYQPLADSLKLIQAAQQGPVICFSPQGKTLTQAMAHQLSQHSALTLVCGRYEAIDQRFIDTHVDMELSIGDYVLSGGETAAMVLMDAIGRLKDGVLHHEQSAAQDSFEEGLLDCPHYTRPPEVDGLTVPDVLLSGDHARIAQWRRTQALIQTLEKRPDLLSEKLLTPEEKSMLQRHTASNKNSKKA